MSIPTEDVYFKTRDEKGDAIVKMTLCQIDARDACRRFPHEYATTPDGHAAVAPPRAVREFEDATGPSGGKPSLLGGIGVKEVIRPAPAAHKASGKAA